MGCMFAKDAKTVGFEQRRERKEEPPSRSGRKTCEPHAPCESTSSRRTDSTENGHADYRVAGAGKPRRRRQRQNPRLSNPPNYLLGEQVAAGWPAWLSAVAGDAIAGWIPRRADSFEKINKIGQGTYSNVYKAKDLVTGKIVALKKVRFDNLEPESVRFMAREILILRRLDHPNVVRLEGLVTSRMSCSLYLVFEYMEHDLAGLCSSPAVSFTESQVKCFMLQLLSGLDHCHKRHVLHRDVKGSNLLIGDDGVLRIADFGLASFFDPNQRQQMTSRVVTLWYRPPELLLGATEYGVGVDLWSAGCILAELLARKPILPGRTEVEQLHKIFKLCGSPSEEYWRRARLPHSTIFKPQHSYKRSIAEVFKDFPPSSLPLIDTLLSIDPDDRLTATSALRSEFFKTAPYACDPSSLPKYPPSKEMDARLRDEEARRMKKDHQQGAKRTKPRARGASGANAELQMNIDVSGSMALKCLQFMCILLQQRRRLATHSTAKSKSEKFPPPHQDGDLGFPLSSSQRVDSVFDHSVVHFSSTIFPHPKASIETWSGPLVDHRGANLVHRTRHRDRR